MESKKAKCIDRETKIAVTRCWDVGGKRERLVKEYKLLAIRLINSGELMYHIVIIVNTTTYILENS